MTLTARTVEALRPQAKAYTEWDDRITGFGVRVQPSGLHSHLVNYCAGDCGRKAPHRRTVIRRHGHITADQASRRARDILGCVAPGDVYLGLGAKILKMREKIKKQTIRKRRLQHQAAAA